MIITMLQGLSVKGWSENIGDYIFNIEEAITNILPSPVG
jgi:hypothetical protein